MARNKEKQFGKLNRLYLEKEKEDALRLRPKRPPLSSLNTVDDIKQWLPSIKRDIDFNLTQTEVICYSDDKITELHKEVDRLKNEYKRFISKMKQLDSSIDEIPWTERPYHSKRIKIMEETNTECDPGHVLTRIDTPIEDRYPVIKPPIEDDDKLRIEGDDQPLIFSSSPVKVVSRDKSTEAQNQLRFSDEAAVLATESKLKKIFGLV